MEEDVKYWLDIAQYDLDTAKSMLESARYIYVLFMCQQATEKLLKAYVTKTTNKFPPRIHNLIRLAEISHLSLDEDRKKFLEKLNYYYLGSRYPEERKTLARDITRLIAQDYYDKTREVFEWLKIQVI